MMYPDFIRAEQAANDLLEKHNITSPPINPELIAEREGVDVVYAQFAPPHNRNVSGFIRFDEDKPRIVVNLGEYSRRQNFTIAHELGHYILHRDYAKGESYEIFLRSTDYSGNKSDEEKEADAFAANLLVPRDMLERYSKVASDRELALTFLVSAEVIKNRKKIMRIPWGVSILTPPPCRFTVIVLRRKKPLIKTLKGKKTTMSRT